MRRFARENSLSLFFGALILGPVGGQSIAVQHAENVEALQHGDPAMSVGVRALARLRWRRPRELAVRVPPVLALHRRHDQLLQKGSNESKKLDETGLESKQKQKIGGYAPDRGPLLAKVDDWRTRLYEHSLLLVMTLIFFATWFGQSLNNWRQFNIKQHEHNETAIFWARYLLDPDFWEKSSRTGSPSSSRSAPWPSSRSTCASAARRSRSRSARHTTRPPRPDSARPVLQPGHGAGRWRSSRRKDQEPAGH